MFWRKEGVKYRGLLYLTGVAVPIICFILALPAAPDYQSGLLGAYALLFLGFSGSCPFWPLLIFSMISMHRALFVPGASETRSVRIGLLGGVILSAQYCLALCALVTHSLILALLMAMGVELALLALIFTVRLIWSLLRKKFPELTVTKVVLTLVALVLSGWLIYFVVDLFMSGSPRTDCLAVPMFSFVFLLIALIIPGPFYCLTAYIYVLLFESDSTVQDIKSDVRRRGLLWLGCYAGTWVTSLPLLLLRYSQLPKHPPGCYVATAAAKGHPWLVGGASEYCGEQKVVVNKQMRTLKCFECLLAIVTPRFHSKFRGFYNCVGPVLARCLRNPIAADITFLLLKPFEYAARLLLHLMLPNAEKSIKSFYRYSTDT